MNRLRRWSALAGYVIPAALLLSAVHGQAPPTKEKKSDEKPAEKWLLDRTLSVTPAAAPVPALKHRLYPSNMERKEGNAVPIYLRFAHERSQARREELREKPPAWNKLPLEELPLDEVKKFLDGYKYNFRQFELGARRRTADWNYTLDAGNPIGLLLPDMQEMRMQASLLVLKARLEIAEHRYADALRTLETGFSFSQQVNEGPFLISSLVGIACASQFADCLLELIERPDAPNVYWALTVLPRPLIDLRKANEFEQIMPELQFPDLADLSRPRSPEQWDAALKRVRKETAQILELDAEGPRKSKKVLKPGTTWKDGASKSPELPAARKYLTEVVGMSAASVEAMPPAQMLLLYIAKYYHELRDDTFKSTYLSFHEGRRLSAEVDLRLKSQPDTEAARLTELLPAILKVNLAQVRIERKLAALRAIEALRMHAAANGGQLPDKLSQVTIAPVPNDPGTGQPFEYQRDGQTATLTSRISGEPLASTGLRYRVTVRK